jgi:hypothetical protein
LLLELEKFGDVGGSLPSGMIGFQAWLFLATTICEICERQRSRINASFEGY